MNGNNGPGPLTIEARRELLKRLLALQEETHVEVISPRRTAFDPANVESGARPRRWPGRRPHRQQTARYHHERVRILRFFGGCSVG